MKEILPFFEKLLERTTFALILLGGGLILISAAGGISVGDFSLFLTDTIWRGIVLAVGIILAGFGVFLLVKDNLKAKQNTSGNEVAAVTGGEGSAEGTSQPPRIIEYSNSDTLGPTFDQFLTKADAVIMVGTGLSLLHDDPRRERLLQRVKDGCKVQIYAANPFSPQVETRLIEEETVFPRPLIAQSGLQQWLRNMIEEIDDHHNFSLKLFPCYPTYAFFIFTAGATKDYFFYPYGYTQLGTFSPVLTFSNQNPADRPMTRFLDDQYKRIELLSTDAKVILDLHDGWNDSQDGNKSHPKLFPFAVYLIPSSDSALYQFGTSVLGYDVRNKSLQPTKWSHAAGAAVDFGFHLTVADALYCTNLHDIRLIAEEVKFIAAGFRPFNINLRLEREFPNRTSIAIVCDDPTGSLEALHHEMVARVYRKAVASNYNFDRSLADRDNDKVRSNLMIKRYHAPYILQRFKPHFSLLSNVATNKSELLYTEIQKLYDKKVVNHTIDIETIAVMSRPEGSKYWEIYQEYKLGGSVYGS